MTINIVGAGIAGLTTAIALEKQGFSPVLYEQAEQLTSKGAGIILAQNAMQVFRKLGLAKKICEQGIVLKALHLTRPDLSPLSSVDFTFFQKKYNLPSVAIHRGVLQRILLEHLQNVQLHTDHKLQSMRQSAHGYELVFENGTSAQASLLIGADGIHSKVRQTLFPSARLRSARQLCWRGVTTISLPKEFKHELREAWGREGRFAFVPIDDHRTYWYAVKSFKQAETLSSGQLRYYFKNFHPLVQDILEATPIHQIHQAEIRDLSPIPLWFDNFACLIGDAAHATTPNMGQGACQAIEDALVLAQALGQNTSSPVEAFRTFQKSRLKTAHQVVNRSWQIGKVAHWQNPVSISIRNLLMNIYLSQNGLRRYHLLS